VPVVITPLAVAEASGTFKVITGVVAPLATEELKSVPVVPKVKAATLVTVPLVLEVPAPMAVRKSDADKASIVLFAFILGKVIADGFVNVKKLPPTVVPPRFVIAPAAVVAPVPPLATGRDPVTPVVSGSPVAFVKTPEAGVPKAGVVSTGLVNVLLVNVSAPANVDKVPVVGKVTDVVAVDVNVVAKAPDVVKLPPKVIVLPVLSTPVPPLAPGSMPL
jgi:hypothetical protein